MQLDAIRVATWKPIDLFVEQPPRNHACRQGHPDLSVADLVPAAIDDEVRRRRGHRNALFWFHKWKCNNRVAPVYRDPNTTHRVDTLRTNPSIFRCRVEGAFSGGGPHPYRWARTQGDDVGAWGYVRDIDIISETNSLPPC